MEPTVNDAATQHKWFAIVNPVAGGGRGLDAFPQISKLLRDNGIPCEPVFTEHKCHATELTVEAVTAIHAGLECGIIGSKYPGLDMISFGPTICYPHSPDEKVEIASVGKFYDFLLHTLRNAPRK